MSTSCHFLWLEGVFDEKTVKAFPSISPASNFWQKGFLNALRGQGHGVDVIGHPVERVWPLGRLAVRRGDASLLPGMRGRVVGFLNVPALRPLSQYFGMLAAVKAHWHDVGRGKARRPDYQVVFSCLKKATDETAAIRVARYVRRRFGVPWLCIVADGEAPPGADGYVHLAWSHYEAARAASGAVCPMIHVDGGIAQIDVGWRAPPPDEHAGLEQPAPRVLMYMGALTAHGGALELAQAFTQVSNDSIELWFCGRGENPELERLAQADPRIHLKGFVDEDVLHALALQAFAFANPRPASFVPNKLNYPSKLLHYLAYSKPVISTFTEGVSPDYQKVLMPMRDESIGSLSQAIQDVMGLEPAQYRDVQRRIAEFNETHTWSHQIGRFMSWLDSLGPRAHARSEAP